MSRQGSPGTRPTAIRSGRRRLTRRAPYRRVRTQEPRSSPSGRGAWPAGFGYRRPRVERCGRPRRWPGFLPSGEKATARTSPAWPLGLIRSGWSTSARPTPAEDRQHQQGRRQRRPGQRVAVSSFKALIRSHPSRLPSRGFSVVRQYKSTSSGPTRIAPQSPRWASWSGGRRDQRLEERLDLETLAGRELEELRAAAAPWPPCMATACSSVWARPSWR